MKHKINGVTEKLLDSAKEEFLTQGFEGANIRSIAKKCGVSTNAIYNRFGSKDQLFSAIVKDAADGLLNIYQQAISGVKKDENTKELLDQSRNGTLQILDYIYEHFDAMTLLFCQSKGSKYESFMDELIAIEEENYKAYIQKMQHKVDDFFLHVKCQMGWQVIKEILLNKLSYEKAQKYMEDVLIYSNAGLSALMSK